MPTLGDLSRRASETLAAASRGIGDRTGIIKQVSERMIETDEPRIFHAFTVATDSGRLYGNPEQPMLRGSSGAGLTREVAMASAVGETFERYCSGIYDDRDLIVSSYKHLQSLGYRVANPSSFALYSQTQYTSPGFIHHPFSEDLEISWVQGYSITCEKPVLVPACLVYVPFRYKHPSDLIAFGVSTGLCCQRSRAEAILGGLYEVVERDAFMCMWMNRMPSPQVEWRTGSWLAPILKERFEPCNVTLHLADITADLAIPVLLGVLVDERQDGLAVAVGASANLDPQTAALKALNEAAQVRRWLKVMKQQSAGHSYRADFTDVVTFEDHVRLFSSLSSIAYLDFLLTNPETTDVTSIRSFGAATTRDDLKTCVLALAEKGFEVIAVDLTQPDISDLGFHVVKVLIPGMIDLNSDHNYPLLGGERLYTLPRRLGHTDRDPQEKELNSVPHPYP